MTPDGDFALVAVSGTNELVVVDMTTRTPVHSIPLGGQPDAVVVNKSGRSRARRHRLDPVGSPDHRQ